MLFPISAGAGQIQEIPQNPGPSPIHLTLLSSMFMHGGNRLYLWIFGGMTRHVSFGKDETFHSSTVLAHSHFLIVPKVCQGVSGLIKSSSGSLCQRR
jgi:hypothetical protein